MAASNSIPICIYIPHKSALLLFCPHSAVQNRKLVLIWHWISLKVEFCVWGWGQKSDSKTDWPYVRANGADVGFMSSGIRFTLLYQQTSHFFMSWVPPALLLFWNPGAETCPEHSSVLAAETVRPSGDGRTPVPAAGVRIAARRIFDWPVWHRLTLVSRLRGQQRDAGNGRAGVWLTVTGKMLTDTIAEEEFDIKEEEPWFDKQDLEHGTVCRLSLSLKHRRKSANYFFPN